MDELVPVILGLTFGAAIWLLGTGRLRTVLSVLVVVVAGVIATVASGECQESWVYLLLDLGEAALGLLVGYVVAAPLLTLRFGRQQGQCGGTGV